MRRNVGLSSLSQQSAALGAYSSLSSTLSEQQLSSLQSQLATFQTALRNFANKHRAKILQDPVFRTHFSDMCNQLGVDPLGSGGRKGIWDYLGVGEWTYSLAVQVVDVCLRNRERSGGLMDLDEVIRGVARLRSGSGDSISSSISSISTAPSVSKARSAISLSKATKPSDSVSTASVTESDVIRAINALEPLGCGYSIIKVGNKRMVRSVAAEFDTDSLSIVEAAADIGSGSITISQLREWTANKAQPAGPGWTTRRAENALEKALMGDGLVWVDDQGEGELLYWMPSLFDFQDEPEG